jgi:hypothetical protein
MMLMMMSSARPQGAAAMPRREPISKLRASSWWCCGVRCKEETAAGTQRLVSSRLYIVGHVVCMPMPMPMPIPRWLEGILWYIYSLTPYINTVQHRTWSPQHGFWPAFPHSHSAAGGRLDAPY